MNHHQALSIAAVFGFVALLFWLAFRGEHTRQAEPAATMEQAESLADVPEGAAPVADGDGNITWTTAGTSPKHELSSTQVEIGEPVISLGFRVTFEGDPWDATADDVKNIEIRPAELRDDFELRVGVGRVTLRAAGRDYVLEISEDGAVLTPKAPQ